MAYGVACLAGQVPLRRVAELGEAACALQVCAHGQWCAAGGYGHAVKVDLGLEVDQVAGQGAWQFARLDRCAIGVRLGQVAGDQVCISLAGGDIAEGQAFADYF